MDLNESQACKTRVRNSQPLEWHRSSALLQREGFSRGEWGNARNDDGHCQVLFAVPSSSLSQYTLGGVPWKVGAKGIHFSQLERTTVCTDVGPYLAHAPMAGLRWEKLPWRRCNHLLTFHVEADPFVFCCIGSILNILRFGK